MNEIINAEVLNADVAPLENRFARLNITWSGQNADLVDPIGIDTEDAVIKAVAKEAVAGGIPGMVADPNADFRDFVVDRFAATGDLPVRIMLRPKTAFGDHIPSGM